MDLRVEKTYRALTEAFTTLLEERRYEEITVAMLCAQADIRRTTFYKHFPDKTAFFSFFVERLLSDMDEPDDEGQKDPSAVFARLVAFLLQHERLIDNLFASSMVGTMALVICDKAALMIRDLHAQDAYTGEAPYRVATEFAAGGIIRLLQLWWFSENREQTQGEFIDAAQKLIGDTLS